MTPRVIVLVSGGGSNLQVLIDADLELQIVLVVSNRKAAFALERAASAGIPTLYAPLKPFTDSGRSRAEYDADLAQKIDALEPDLIVLAGWMHVFTRAFLEQIGVPVINLHPALPGQFPGSHAIEDAYQAWLEGKITASGCMVHHVIPELDAGEAIATRVVPFQTGDTLEIFANRLHATEHELIVTATRKILKRLAHQYSLNRAQEMCHQGASSELILRFLRWEGFNQIASMQVMKRLKNLSVAEAKKLVCLSETWSDEYTALENAIKESQSESA